MKLLWINVFRRILWVDAFPVGAGLARDGGVSDAVDVDWQVAIAGMPGSHRVLQWSKNRRQKNAPNQSGRQMCSAAVSFYSVRNGRLLG